MKTLTPIVLAFGLITAGCSSANIMEPPKALPDNWAPPEVHAEQMPYLRGAAPNAGPNDVRAASLWSSSPKSLFGDQRASQYGDILTVVVEIDDEAEMINSSSQTRQSDQDFSVNALFGLPEYMNSRVLPTGASLAPAVDLNRSSAVTGNGNIKREEKLTLRLAARVVEVLPNGYLSLAGRQEIMVNNETRYLQVTGLVRTQDISRRNTITYDKIAEARIFYGGQGQVTQTVKPGLGNKVLSKIIPF